MASQNTMHPASAQAPATNTAAVATLPAPTDGSHWKIKAIIASYSGTPTGGSLVIAWTEGSTNYAWTIYIAASGATVITLPDWFVLPSNTAATVTLAAGGSGVTGTVYPLAETNLS
jgi:hypothetical protein